MAPTSPKFKLKVPDEIASLLKGLHPLIKSHLRSGLQAIIEDPWCGKALKEEFCGLRSYRVKRYRIVYRIRSDEKILELVAIGPRRVIYEETYRIILKESDSEP